MRVSSPNNQSAYNQRSICTCSVQPLSTTTRKSNIRRHPASNVNHEPPRFVYLYSDVENGSKRIVSVSWSFHDVTVPAPRAQHCRMTDGDDPRPRATHTAKTIVKRTWAGGPVPAIFSAFNITPMGVAWKESTSNGSRPPPLNRRTVAPPLGGP